ncbi:copper resistance protein NlpE N-terminal domain-containing protein [Spirosoma sp. BT702]|uniref:Copper resistance protein NlpE N-terminal domain-containing protein n=1 Tax=Spirosoma profusum TaxID=2771354 RepID=A0A926XV74_9BACT|nr:copper resistance protein NlpE N-terminal domain-containing protein [Spirosoma profusum]MBD2701168.1 copper resistance protein NlpE N-terminal domain-containing protein [Spirosoma profusum]
MKPTLSFLLLGFFFTLANSIHAQEARLANVPSKSNSRKPIASGPLVVGVFAGRFPCSEIAKDWKYPERPECTKVKWAITFFQDSVTHQPTTYHLLGTLNRQAAREGKWSIVKGTKTEPEAIVYQLDPDKPDVSVYLLKGDDNVLFILDQQRKMRVGDDYLSYTLNRIVN